MIRYAGMRRLLLPLIPALAVALLGVETLTASAAQASEAPAITSPTDGSTVCSSNTIHVTGTGTPGAAVVVYVSGNTGGSTTVAGDGTWATDVIALETQTLTATQDDGSGTSAESAAVSVFALVTPTLSGMPYPTFSPANADGYLDTARFNLDFGRGADYAPLIEDGSGTVVRHLPSKYAAWGDKRAWLWDGRDDAGALVPDGAYSAHLAATRNGVTCVDPGVGSVSHVDNTAPRFASWSRSAATFYPRVDDAFRPWRNNEVFTAYTVDSFTNVKARIFHYGATKPFMVVDGDQASPGHNAHLRWNGRLRNSDLLPEGRYTAQIEYADEFRNVRTRRSTFYLSHKHLVYRHRNVMVAGRYYASKVQNNSCGMKVRPAASKYTNGVRLDYCGKRDADVSYLIYRVKAPRATYLANLQPIVYGYCPTGDNNLAMIAWNFDDATGWMPRYAGPREGLHAPGRIIERVSRFVDSHGYSEVFALYAGRGHYDYDIARIGYSYQYAVLRE